jgi:hypothetical protein
VRFWRHQEALKAAGKLWRSKATEAASTKLWRRQVALEAGRKLWKWSKVLGEVSEALEEVEGLEAVARSSGGGRKQWRRLKARRQRTRSFGGGMKL